MTRKACPVTKAGFVRLITSVIAVRLCQALWGHTHKLLSRGQPASRAGYVCGREGRNLYFSDSSYQEYQQAVLWRPPARWAICLPKSLEQVVFNQGLQVLVCEILCFEGHMRSVRRRVISVQTSGILCSLVTSDDVLVNTYRKANLY